MKTFNEDKFVLLTHITFVLERESTTLSSAVEMRGPLPKERTVRSPAFLRGPEPLKTFLNNRRIFSMVVRVHLHVRRGYVHFIAPFLDAMVMRLLLVVRAVGVPVGTIVQRAVPHEAVLQALVPLLVPLEVPDHLLLLEEHPRVAVETVEVLSVVEVLAVGTSALDRGGEFLDVLGVIHLRLGFVHGGTLMGLLVVVVVVVLLLLLLVLDCR